MELWERCQRDLQRSRGLRNVMCIRSVTENMIVGLCKNTEERIGPLVRFNMKEEKFFSHQSAHLRSKEVTRLSYRLPAY